MASCNGGIGREPLLTGKPDPSDINYIGSFKSRKLRKCKSAPMMEEPVPEDNSTKMDRFYEGPTSIFEQLKPKFGRVALYLFVYLGLCTFCFYLVRDQIIGIPTHAIVDCLYFCIVTMTTVGYGDILPNSTTTKLLSCAFVFIGMALVGLSISKAADCLVENQEILLVRALHLRQKTGAMEILKDTETNKVRYRCIIFLVLLIILITVGTVFLTTVEKMEVIDAFYCVCTTMTTLGYGDKTFSTMPGRVFAIFWILMSTVCLAQVLFAFAELYTENRQKELATWVLTRKTTVADLEAADLNDDGVVGALEFVIYKLKEMGKINQEDIAVIMAEFEKLDADDSGSLTVADISQAQSQQ